MVNIELPLTLLPHSNSEDRFDLTVRAASFRFHVDRLEVQAWALEIADWWEDEGVHKGFERFSFGVGPQGLSSNWPYADACILGKEVKYNCFSSDGKLRWEVKSARNNMSASEKALDADILKFLDAFPCNPKEKRWSVAFENPDGHTLPDWRQSILNLLDPEDLANFQAQTLAEQTPSLPSGSTKRL